MANIRKQPIVTTTRILPSVPRTKFHFRERKSQHFSLKMLRFFYQISGGIYAARTASRTVKILWITISAALLTLIIPIGSFGYLWTAEQVDLLSVYALFWSVDCGINIIVIVPAITYRYHREFEILLNFIEENAVDEDFVLVTTSQYLRNSHSFSEVSFWMIAELIVTLLFAMIGPIDMMFLCKNENSFRDLHHHLIGYPYMHLVSSKSVALLIYSIESIFWVTGITIALSHVHMLMIIVAELNNIVAKYCRQVSNLGAYINDETPTIVFRENFIYLIQRHQHLVKMMKIMTPFIQTFITITRITIVAGLLSIIYVILLTDLEIMLKLKQLFLAVLFGIYLYPQCEFGHKINLMIYSIHHNVYDLPWYCLPPKERTLVYIFLCQAQAPIEFKAFTIYPVNRQTFPRVIHTTYTLLNLLRPTINSRHIPVT